MVVSPATTGGFAEQPAEGSAGTWAAGTSVAGAVGPGPLALVPVDPQAVISAAAPRTAAVTTRAWRRMWWFPLARPLPLRPGNRALIMAQSEAGERAPAGAATVGCDDRPAPWRPVSHFGAEQDRLA